jgi:hypothetical protein
MLRRDNYAYLSVVELGCGVYKQITAVVGNL